MHSIIHFYLFFMLFILYIYIYIYIYIFCELSSKIRKIPPEVLSRIVFLNQKPKHMGERRGVYRVLVGKPE